MRDGTQSIRFEIFEEGELVDICDVERDVVKVGSLASSHLELDGPGVSRVHAVIERSDDGAYHVIDLGSGEGTHVDGEEVTKCAVESGDEVVFGDTRVRLEFVDGDRRDDAEPSAGADVDRGEPLLAEYDGESGGETLEVAHLWSGDIQSVTTFDEGRTVTLGGDEGADFQVGEDLVSGNRRSLVEWIDGRYHLVVCEGLRGYVRRGGSERTLRELKQSGGAHPHPTRPNAHIVPLDPYTSARVELGDNNFLIHFAKMPADVGSSVGVDRDPVPYQATSAVAHVAFLLLCMSLPGTVATLQADQYTAEDRYVDLMRTPEQQTSEEEPEWMENSGGEETGSRREGKEGKAGSEEAEERDRKMAVEGPPDQEETTIKKRDEKVAMEAGLMKSFDENEIASKWGSSAQSIGDDAVTASGNLEGDRQGSAWGTRGLGLEDSGRGGGGTISDSGVGLGTIGGDIGGDGPPGEGLVDAKEPDLGEAGENEPEVYSPPPEVTGALDRETVRKVVRQHRREMKYCYEKELQKNPSLQGQVTVEFTISGNGEVMAAIVTESTLGTAAVEQCMQQKIRNWTFPNPKRGKMVKVTYPFNFSRGGH